ncbi:MAG: PEP-CTERM sorting domain-containing protein [Pseudomonadota bacterium]|nr:PEP-CTERM sorting domain-containing protein [Pseudomonadota bacterium]
MRIVTLSTASAFLGMMLQPLTAGAAPMTFSDESNFLSALGLSTTYDFETDSGFPADGGHIGTFDSINFDAQTHAPLSTTSGSQAMAGAGETCCFGTATLTFAAGISGLGFYAEDLLNENEIVRLSVNLATGPDQVYDIGLGDADPFTPIYFGVLDNSDNIVSATWSGTDESGNTRAWYIDDLSTNATSVPEPGTMLLLGAGLIGLLGVQIKNGI